MLQSEPEISPGLLGHLARMQTLSLQKPKTYVNDIIIKYDWNLKTREKFRRERSRATVFYKYWQ